MAESAAGSAATYAREADLRNVVIGFLRGYTGPLPTAADELISIVRRWDAAATRQAG